MGLVSTSALQLASDYDLTCAWHPVMVCKHKCAMQMEGRKHTV